MRTVLFQIATKRSATIIPYGEGCVSRKMTMLKGSLPLSLPRIGFHGGQTIQKIPFSFSP
jgi:hypothetical protein